MSDTHGPSEPGLYKIRIQGHLDDRWADWFDGLRFTHERDGTTTLNGLLTDQSALHSVLNGIRDLGLPIILVQYIAPDREKEIKMNSDRKSSIIIGGLFIAAAVFSILGLGSYGPILNNPEYLTHGPTSENQIVLGAIFEMLTAVTVAGTAIAFFPILRKHNETIAMGYVGGRFLEAVLIVIGLVSLLTLLTLRQEFASGVALEAASLQTADRLLRSTHRWAFMLGPNFMLGINTLLYSSVLYRTKLVSRPLAVLGLVGAGSVFTASILELFGVIEQISAWGAALALPVGAFEISLAISLIVKGFKGSAVASGYAKTEAPAFIGQSS